MNKYKNLEWESIYPEDYEHAKALGYTESHTAKGFSHEYLVIKKLDKNIEVFWWDPEVASIHNGYFTWANSTEKAMKDCNVHHKEQIYQHLNKLLKWQINE